MVDHLTLARAGYLPGRWARVRLHKIVLCLRTPFDSAGGHVLARAVVYSSGSVLSAKRTRSPSLSVVAVL
jgi:hypothetical protein